MKICNDSVHQAIDEGLGHLELTAEQKQAILAQCRPTVALHRPKAILFKRVAAVAACAAVFTVSSLGVVASSPALADRLGMLGQHVQTILQPIELSAMDDGIRMEVLAALNDADVAAVYLTLQDTTGQNRITEDIDLRHFQISGATFTSAQVIGFDEATNTATLCMTGEGGDLADRKVSVTLRSFLTGWNVVDHTIPARQLLDELALPAPQLQPAKELHGLSSVDSIDWLPEDALDHPEKLSVLKSSNSGAFLPEVPWLQVTAAGVADGALHLQILRDDQMGVYNQITFTWLDENGQPIEVPSAQADLGQEFTIAPGWSEFRLQEHILKLPQGKNINDLTLGYTTYAYDACRKGVWSVAFPLEAAEESITIPCPRQMDGWVMQDIQISALGVTIRGRSENSSPDLNDSPIVTVLLDDGTQADFFSSSVYYSENIAIKQLFRTPLDLDRLGQVLLNDESLSLPA